MSNRIRGFIVTFANDTHPEYAAQVKSAIECFQEIASVVPVEADAMSVMTREQVRREFLTKIYATLEKP